MWQEAYGGVSRHACNVSEFVNGPHALHKLDHARSIDHTMSYYIHYMHIWTRHALIFLSAPVRTHTHKLTQTRAFFFARSKESKVLGVLDLLCLLADVQLLLFPAMLQLFVTCIHLRARFCFQQDPTASAELCFPYPKFI